MHDDAYILFRYAANLADGHGFAFNASEPVYGASSPLYVLILAVVAKILSPSALPYAARIISMLSVILSAILLYKYIPQRH